MKRRPTAILAVVLLAGCSAGPTTHSGARGTTLPSGADSRPGPTTGPSANGSSTTASPGASGLSSSVPTACSDQSVVASWSVALKAAQVLVVPALDADPASVAVARSQRAGGILLLGRLPSGPQVAAVLGPAVAPPASSRSVVPPFAMVDQEGGGVQRLGADVASLPWPRQMAASMTPAQVRQSARTLGRQMAALSVGVDLAPVLDLDGGPELSASDPDGPRSFSTDPSTAAAYGEAFVSGLRAGGVLAVVKHFPGLGGSTGNTDYGPASTRSIGQLRSGGLVPFQRAIHAGVRAVMVANASVPGLTSAPASLSAAVITGLLRGQLHFDGLVMTDSLSAGAVRAAGYAVPAAAVAALEAGADMVLFGSTLTAADTAALAPGPLASRTHALVQAISQAVASGALPMARLDAAALHVVQSKGLNLCAAGRG